MSRPSSPTATFLYSRSSYWAIIVVMLIRLRTTDDLDDCERLARCVHRVDGYPPYLPDGDIGRFIRSPEALHAWVAEIDDEIVGHVVLNDRSSEPVMALASAMTGRERHSLVVVARLLVAPDARRKAVGRALLLTAAQAGARMGRRPILDVATRFSAAIALYKACGWSCAGEVTVSFPDGTSIREAVFVAPATGSGRAGST